LAGASIPKTSEGPKTLEEKIVWFVDAMLMDDEPVPINERMDRAVGSEISEARTARNTLIHELH